MKPLSPSLKTKKRYLSFMIISKSKLGDILKELKRDIASYFGQKGMTDSALQVIKYDKIKQTGIIKVSHKYINQLKTALILIPELNQKKILIKSLKVSGILKRVSQNCL